MANPKFSASFTAGSLFVNEFTALRTRLNDENLFEQLDEEIKQNKLLSIKSEAARKRVISEIKKRIKAVDASFWQLFPQWNDAELRLGLFYVCMKTYSLVFDLHFEVIIKRWKVLEKEVSTYDIQMRLDELVSDTEVADQWTYDTQQKLITVFLRMLREAKLLKNNTLEKPEITNPEFWNYFIHQGDAWFLDACFLTKHEKEALL